jgi:hypothetical protein
MKIALDIFRLSQNKKNRSRTKEVCWHRTKRGQDVNKEKAASYRILDSIAV